MKRKIIHIERDKCNGCGLCIDACHEGALKLIDGKAELVSDSYCDGLGDCLPQCPTGAISIIEREAAEFDEEAVNAHLTARAANTVSKGFRGYSGTLLQAFAREKSEASPVEKAHTGKSELRQWPIQLQLVPVNAPYFTNAHLLVAADCTAIAYGSIHQDFMRNRVTLIGCPKLDEVDYASKLTEILTQNEIASVTVLKMEVPCCGGLSDAVKTALQNSGKMISWTVITVSLDGSILEH